MSVTTQLLTVITAFGVTAALGLPLIPFLRRMKFGQTILDIGPAWHKKKQDTPTMGGIMFVAGATIAILAGFALGTFQDAALAADRVGNLCARQSTEAFARGLRAGARLTVRLLKEDA